jgi:hypothetical protein
MCRNSKRRPSNLQSSNVVYKAQMTAIQITTTSSPISKIEKLFAAVVRRCGPLVKAKQVNAKPYDDHPSVDEQSAANQNPFHPRRSNQQFVRSGSLFGDQSNF